ncbi:dethiobiotin synthase, partial [Klebsiella pneumoniae]
MKNKMSYRAIDRGRIPWLADIAQRDDLGQYLDLRALDPALSTAPAAAHPAP